MRTFLSVVVFLALSLSAVESAWSSTSTPPGVVPSLSVGGRVFTDLANLKILTCYSRVNANSTGSISVTPYVVPGSKSFYALAVEVQIPNGTTAVQGAQLAYSDASVGQDSASALTNPIFYTGGTSTAYVATVSTAAAGNSPNSKSIYFVVPTGKYLNCIATSGGGSGLVATIYGYER